LLDVDIDDGRGASLAAIAYNNRGISVRRLGQHEEGIDRWSNWPLELSYHSILTRLIDDNVDTD